MANQPMKGKPETMGRRLAAARALKGLSQTEASGLAGFAQPYLSDLENDKAERPPLDTVARLAAVYGVSIDYLWKGEAA